MPKRQREADDKKESRDAPSKRSKVCGRNHFDDLSDELALRVFSSLPVADLTVAERTCKRFHSLAVDNEIWREKFYNNFVRPRARRIPGLDAQRNALHYSSKSARWLEHSSRSDKERDWKKRYRLKLNWSKGRCRAQEMPLDCPVRPRLLVRMCNGTITTASTQGLRSYSQRARPQLLSSHYWEHDDHQKPTAMSVDKDDAGLVISVGFEHGSFEIYRFNDHKGFYLQHTQTTPAVHSAVVSMAMSWPYILTFSANHHLALYEAQRIPSATELAISTLTELRSEAILSPVSLSLRKTSSALVASIAYSFTRLNAGWCIGIQEIRLSLDGDVVDSRLTSTVGAPSQDFPLAGKAKVSSRSASTDPLPLHPMLMHPPNSLSHAGCYIVAGLSDNTLMVYTVTSTSDSLHINGGRRLWGHTSSVSGTQVSERGKALSVSAKGDEVRVWELEDMLSSYSLQKTSTQLKPWPQHNSMRDVLNQRGPALGPALCDLKDELPWTRHWIGFDDEQVVVHGERDQRQVLSCYDFA